jgi:hypothetical protein
MCLCVQGRYGAGALAWAIYYTYLEGGLRALLSLLLAGEPGAILEAAVGLVGGAMMFVGVREALSHDDEFDMWSFLYSAGAVGLALYAMQQGWFLTGSPSLWRISHGIWLGLLASNGFNLWLQLRGPRHAVRSEPVSPARSPNINSIMLDDPQPVARHRLRRSRTIKIVEVIEGQGVESLARHLGANTPYYPPPHASPVIGRDGRPVPQILYVQDEETGEFIPVLPDRVALPRKK